MFQIAGFQKDFQGHTTVLRNSLFKLSFSGSRVKLENPDFEKTFDVYSTDQIEARYLLSPSMMERLLALDREFNKNITISFKMIPGFGNGDQDIGIFETNCNVFIECSV